MDGLRSLTARLIVQHLRQPHPLVIRAWLWLAAEAGTLEEKRRCLWAVLDLDPDNTNALLALAVLRLGKPED